MSSDSTAGNPCGDPCPCTWGGWPCPFHTAPIYVGTARYFQPVVQQEWVKLGAPDRISDEDVERIAQRVAAILKKIDGA